MNSYRIDDLEVGRTQESFKVEVTLEMMEGFERISGDSNPLHVISEYAKNNGFRERVVYGMLTASFYSRLVGVYLPGQYCILQEIETSFYKPAYVGDVLVVCGKVVEKDEGLKRVTIFAKITNEEGKRVSKAIIKVGFLHE